MVYCNRCATAIAQGYYCVQCQPASYTPTAPSTELSNPTANNSLVYNKDWKKQNAHAYEMSAANAVSTLHIECNGQFIDATFSPDRKQCACCLQWFPDKAGYDWHRSIYPTWCTEHGICFPREEVHYHGVAYEHDRCFVGDCPSKYRHETGWTLKQIKEHVKKAHNYAGKAMQWT
jgi:hypothetical protein